MGKPAINLVAAGAGSNGLIEAVIIDELRRSFDIVRAGGASAGSINAAGCALGLQDLTGFWRKFLTTGGLEDFHFPGPLKPLGVLKSAPRCGMMAGNRIYRALYQVTGETRLSDLPIVTRIVVGNLSKRKTQIVDSQLGLIEIEPDGSIKQADESKRHALVADALRCSLAVPFVVDAAKLVPDEPHLYTDGGVGANSPSGLWDDFPFPTLMISFKNNEQLRPVKSLKDFAFSIFDIRQDSSNSAIGTKKPGKVFKIEIEASGDSLDFSLTEKEADRRIAEGIKMIKRLDLKPLLEPAHALSRPVESNR